MLLRRVLGLCDDLNGLFQSVVPADVLETFTEVSTVSQINQRLAIAIQKPTVKRTPSLLFAAYGQSGYIWKRRRSLRVVSHL